MASLFCGLAFAALVLVPACVPGQAAPPVAQHVGPLLRPNVTPEPTDPAPQNFEDVVWHVAFHLPPGWQLARKDGELSTFPLDARTAPARARLRGVAELAFNPFPTSTFSGAMFYFSVTPHSTAAACDAQAVGKPNQAASPVRIAGANFARGRDEHGKICTEARNTTYTTLHKGTCVRFDLTINTFCGGEVSGVQDMTLQQLTKVQERLGGILDTVRFTD